MITTIPRKGTSVAGLLDYLGSPKREGAELLVTNLAGDSLEDWARQIEGLSRCHFPRRNHLSKHLILSFAPGEQLERDTLEEITRVYLEGMGYQDSPYVVFLHRDREHWHLHIATTPTTWQGEPVRENWDWPRSERVARKIEERFGLVRVPLSETAALRAPSLGEVRERKKTGEPSARERFQQDIHRAGVASKSLADFLARLRLAGYQVRLLVDRQRRIRGISFAKGEFAFKGSQLGKAYQGARFLETFGLSYDPERDSGTIASRAVERPDLGEPRPARRVALQESAPSEKPRSSRAAEPAARSLPLPEGSYHVAAFNPRIDSEQHFGRRPEGARAWFHFGLSAAEVARSREAWQEATPGHDLWIRFTQHGTAIAFQGISRQALDRLRAAGFEPSWTVAMGERFDVLYRIEKLGETDRSEAAGLLRERFGLPPGLNVWSDGVRLPGARVVSLPEAPRAELVASRPGTLPLAALLREGRARRQQARELEVLTQKLAARLPQEPEPAQPRGGGPRLAVKTDVEILRGAYRTESLNRALSAHGGSREALRRGFETAELYAAEIEYRAWEALEAHRAARARAQEAASQLGAAYALAGRERSDQALLAYQSAASRYARLELEADRLEARAQRWPLAQARLERWKALVSCREHPGPATFYPLVEAITREARASARAGRLAWPRSFASVRCHRFALGEACNELGRWLEPRFSSSRASRAELGETARAVKVHALLRLALEDKLPARERQLPGFADATPYRALWRQHEELRPAQLLSRPALWGDPLARAAEPVGAGDLRPQALRHLALALVAQTRARWLTLPHEFARDSAPERYQRLEALESSLARDTAELARLGSRAPEGLQARLIQDASEAVALHRFFQAQERNALAYFPPDPPPGFVDRTHWNAAWLANAERYGLPLRAARDHWENAATVPFLAPATNLTESAAQLAADTGRKLIHFLRQALEEDTRQDQEVRLGRRV